MKKIDKKSKVILVIFWICFLIIYGFFVLEISLTPKDDPLSESNVSYYNNNWKIKYADGTVEKITLPTIAHAKAGEWITLTNTLPMNLSGIDTLRLRSSQQDMYVYVNGKLRTTYSDKYTRLYGSSSPNAYLFVRISQNDAGKEIKIVSMSSIKSYENALSGVRMGTQQSILLDIFNHQWLEVLLGSIVLMFGCIFIIGHWAIRFILKKNIYIGYLGTFAIMIATWVLCESKMRQFYSDHIFALSIMTIHVLLLCPVPILTYMDYLQKRRFTRFYQYSKIISLLFFFLSILFQMIGIDFIVVFPYFAFIIVFDVSGVLYTSYRDYKENKKGYGYIVIVFGLLVMGITGIMEIIRMQVDRASSLGRFICLGVMFFLFSVAYSTVKYMQSDIQEKHDAIEANKAKSSFLAHMSHEIRTPLNAILGMNEMILRESLDPQISGYAANIKEASKNLLSLINDVLDYTKIESGKLELISVKYDLASIVNDLYNMVRFKVKDKGLKLEICVNPQIPSSLYGDEVRLRQVILNLLSNAIKYTKKGSIVLRMDYKIINAKSIYLKVEVEDTGIGIKEEEIDTLFEAFKRVDEQKNRDIEGSGLGLNICQQILSLAKSKLYVESQYKKGSKFYFDVIQEVNSWKPVENISKMMNIDEMNLVKPYTADFIAPQANILIVDDNEMNLMVAKALLKETKVKVETAKSGEACLDMIHQKHYDIIFLDHLMPQMDGIETLQHIIANRGACEDTPVIAMTANVVSGAREKYLEYGFFDYIPKPIEASRFEKIIKKYLPSHLILNLPNEMVFSKESNVYNTCGENKGSLDTESQREENNIYQKGSGFQNETLKHIFSYDDFNFEIAMLYSADGQEGVLDNIHFYLMEEENTKAKLSVNITHETLKGYRILVHSMKNTAKIIGAMKFSEYAREMEEEAKKENIVYVKEKQQDFYHQYSKMCDKLREAK